MITYQAQCSLVLRSLLQVQEIKLQSNVKKSLVGEDYYTAVLGSCCTLHTFDKNDLKATFSSNGICVEIIVTCV